MPVSQAIDQTINIALSNGVTKSVALQGGDAASEVAENLNGMLQNLGIRAKASNRVELSGLSASGTVSFKIEGDNRTPIEILTNVVPEDLTNLVTSINNQSSRTGITASLSTNKNV